MPSRSSEITSSRRHVTTGRVNTSSTPRIAALKAGKHVQVEIPMADRLADAEDVVKAQSGTGLIAMAGHTRRFNPSHQWIHKRILAGELRVLQMDVQTYFFRRTNMNALGQPRSWTDHLLWHHACHTVDLFQYQTAETASERVEATTRAVKVEAFMPCSATVTR